MLINGKIVQENGNVILAQTLVTISPNIVCTDTIMLIERKNIISQPENGQLLKQALLQFSQSTLNHKIAKKLVFH